jgi:polysaccharide chain length determinant protein (PEP-CTERM system associated)
MNAFFPQLMDLLRGVRHGRWVGLAVAWIAGVAGAGFLFLTPDRYEATARVYVDTQSILKPLMKDLTVQPNVEQEVAILSRTLISRPNLQKLIRTTDMDLKVTSAEERERLIDSLARILYIKSVGHGNLYTIGFTHTDPAQATRVVQSLLSIFVESGLSAKSNDTGNAKRFIEEQIKAYEQRLTEAENRVKEFKLRNLDLNAAGDFFGSLSTLTEQVREARLLLQEAQRSRDALKQQMSDEEDRPAPLMATLSEEAPAVATPELDARLTTLNKNLDEMLLRYTDMHPDVVNTQRIVREVEAQREEQRKRLGEELDKRRRAAPAQVIGGSGNTAYPQLKLALAEAEAQVARLRARVEDLEKRYAQQRDRARSVPEREAQFAQLNRDYSIQKRNYDTLVARREAALMSGEVEAATGVADFRIIDPPRVSPTPVFPDRKKLMSLVLLGSLCAGIFASYVFSVARPVFHDNGSLKRAVQRPVLGAVSLIANAAVRAKRRRSRLMFLGGAGGLAATYSAAIAVVFFKDTLPF